MIQRKNDRHSASFRDKDGFVFQKNGQILRQVNQSYQENYELLISSGLYQKLVDEGWMVAHQEIGLENSLDGQAYKILKPAQLEFISYPYEWCFSQLKAAALLTLEMQELALEYDMSLKDASAFNIQFENGEPIFIDTLSFEKFDHKPWVAYKQFCQHFLNPLSLMSKVDSSLNKLMAIYLDGIPIELTAKLLPLSAKFNPNLFVHISLHARQYKKTDRRGKTFQKEINFSKNSMKGLISSLKSAVAGLKLKDTSFWSGYNPGSDSYSASAFRDKERIVLDFFKKTKAGVVWDLGSNDGHFSRLLGPGVKVISTDFDPMSVETNYQLSREMTNILPLILDLTNPTPSLGWGTEERMSILERANADCLLALALIHHLAIAANVPMEKVAEFFSHLGKYLIIEFVPKEDRQVQELLSLRKNIFVDYNKEGFEKTFGQFYKIIQVKNIKGSLRSLYLMERK